MAEFVLERLADLGPDAAPAVPAVESIIRSQMYLEARGIRTLMWIGPPAAEALVKALRDLEREPSEWAGQALAMIAPRCRPVLPQLAELAATAEQPKSTTAARAMAVMGEDERGELVTLLGAASPARVARRRARKRRFLQCHAPGRDRLRSRTV